MNRRTRLLVMSCLCTIVLSAGAAPAPAQADYARYKARAAVFFVNYYRSRHGLRPVRLSPLIERTSRSYARVMIRRNRFSHAPRPRAAARFRRWGEVIQLHFVTRWTSRQAVRAWMNSPSHRRVLLDPRFRYVGAGVVGGRFAGRSATAWVMRFGR